MEDNFLRIFNKVLYCSDVKDSREARRALVDALNTLKPREAIILTLRNLDMTLADIAEIVGVTKERIRQIEATGYRKLRHPSRRQLLATCSMKSL